MLLRMRLQCVVTEDGEPVPWEDKDLDSELFAFPAGLILISVPKAVHAMNEVTLHRGASPHLIKIMTSIDNQELTEVVVSLFPTSFRLVTHVLRLQLRRMGCWYAVPLPYLASAH